MQKHLAAALWAKNEGIVVVPPQGPGPTIGPVYNLGDDGPDGGIVYYVDGYSQHGLEAGVVIDTVKKTSLRNIGTKTGLPQ